MTRWIALLLVLPTVLFSVSCGGGANDVDENPTVFLTVAVDNEGDFIEAEMIKEVTTTTAVATITVGSIFDNISTTVGTVILDRYEVSYTRDDGGSPTPATYSGTLAGTVIAPDTVGGSNTLSEALEFEFVAFPTSEKTYSDFAREFTEDLYGLAPDNVNDEPGEINDALSVTFDCQLTIHGHNLAGDNLTARGGFKVQAAVFGDLTELAPSIASFDQTSNVTVGDDYFASWVVFNGVTAAQFLFPWGEVRNLSPSGFPAGSISSNTSFLADDIGPGQSAVFPTGSLVVANPFGAVQSVASSTTVTLSSPSADPVVFPQIVNFFSDRTEIALGESVNLTWDTSDADTLEMLPNTFSGVEVDFTGKDPDFDSVSITPDYTVRPLLRASNAAGGFTSEFLEAEIVVIPPVSPEPTPGAIAFFNASRSLVTVGGQVVLFWDVTGEVTKVELFPISNERVDVTNRNSYLTPALVQAGDYTFSLVVTDTQGNVIKSDVLVSVTEDINENILIENIVQQPASAIDNEDQGSFRFTINDPERADSSWRVRKIAGDSVTFSPREGKVGDGRGDASVGFSDGSSNGQGFFTFELSAYDDSFFGTTRNATKAVELITFTTTGAVQDNAPVISNVEFLPAGDPGDVPNSEGVISFTFEDRDTQDLDWSVTIVAGDFGGSLEPAAGRVTNGAGDISVRYVDDADTPTDPVVFRILVRERNTNEDLQDIALLRIDKDPSAMPTEPPPPDLIALPFDGLYANLFGGVVPEQEIRNYILFYNGNAADPQFYRNSDLSGEVFGMSIVGDFNHDSGDPSTINSVDYTRNFLTTPNSSNVGGLESAGFLDNAGSTQDPSSTPITGGVHRFFMAFGVQSFREPTTDVLNLPAAIPGQENSQTYTITFTATDEDGTTRQFTRTLTVIVPAQ